MPIKYLLPFFTPNSKKDYSDDDDSDGAPTPAVVFLDEDGKVSGSQGNVTFIREAGDGAQQHDFTPAGTDRYIRVVADEKDDDNELFEPGAYRVTGTFDVVGCDFPLDRDAPRITLLVPVSEKAGPLCSAYFETRKSSIHAVVERDCEVFEGCRGSLRADEAVALVRALGPDVASGFWARSDADDRPEFPPVIDQFSEWFAGIWMDETGRFLIGLDLSLPRVACEQIRLFCCFGGADARALASDQGVLQRAEARLFSYAKSIAAYLAEKLDVVPIMGESTWRTYSTARIVDGTAVVYNRCACASDGQPPIIAFESEKMKGIGIRTGTAADDRRDRLAAREATLPKGLHNGAVIASRIGANRTLFPISTVTSKKA